MKVDVKPGKYILAVSGGVDSVVLLDLLSKQDGLELVVTNFDHGIRDDSELDSEFVVSLADEYDLPFAGAGTRLGENASEEQARDVRYGFLNRVKIDEKAKAIITAHHRDDSIETAVFNVLRGTGRKGVSALQSGNEIIRPLINKTKSEIIEYAKSNNLEWREDSTNRDNKYTRNWIRNELVPKLNDQQKRKIASLHESHKVINVEVDAIISEIISTRDKCLERSLVISSDHIVAKELIASWLRMNGISEFNSGTIERIVRDGKVSKPGKYISLNKDYKILITKKDLQIEKNH